jgi:hypothetical protein
MESFLGIWLFWPRFPETSSGLEVVRFLVGFSLGPLVFPFPHSTAWAELFPKREEWTVDKPILRRVLLRPVPVLLVVSLAMFPLILLAELAWKAKAWVWVGAALLLALGWALEVVLAIKQPSGALLWAMMAAVVMGLTIALMWEGMRYWREAPG